MKKAFAAAVLAAAFSLGAVTAASAATFNVTGANMAGNTLSGTLEADATLTNVTSVDLVVSGPGLIQDGPLTIVSSYASPFLAASGPFHANVAIFLSFAGGPTPSEIDALILSMFDPALCGGNVTCESFVRSQQTRAFSAIASPAEVPLPPALAMFASGLGLVGLLSRQRKRRVTASL
jgi:hypothetical protein